jgi:MFS family permease
MLMIATQSATQTRYIFYLIVAAQFCGTSVWFAGNAIIPQLQGIGQWPASATGWVTSATQLGFIFGTLIFALTGLADKNSPSKLFFICSIFAAGSNLLALSDLSSFPVMIVSRVLVGIFLAGIYPVGMKIAADWQSAGLGHWLGALVGALVLGTALPHGVKGLGYLPDPGSLLIAISALCIVGGVLVLLFVPDGPFRKPSTNFSFSVLRKSFADPEFRAPALGYFGHMWELYALWAFLPFLIRAYAIQNDNTLNTSWLAFLIIGVGGLGCYLGGRMSFRLGSDRVATLSLIASGVCCILSPFILAAPLWLFLSILIFWGIMVAADSPQFSALVSKTAPAENRGSAITLVICIGFSITIVSIQLLSELQSMLSPQYLLLILAPGPIVGVISMRRLKSKM